MFADLIDGHVLLQSPEGQSDDSAFRDVEPGPADEAGDSCFLEEFEEVVVEVQGGGPGGAGNGAVTSRNGMPSVLSLVQVSAARRYWVTVSRLMPNSRARAAFRFTSPSAGSQPVNLIGGEGFAAARGMGPALFGECDPLLVAAL